MPELPEVETVRRGLEPVLSGALVTSLDQRRADLRFALPPHFAERIKERRIVALGRRAKYLLFDLDDGWVLIAHLGMSGSFRIERTDLASMPGAFHLPRSKDTRHDHIVFNVEGRQGPARIVYNDPRRFGFMTLARRVELETHVYFAGLGPEPTGNALEAGFLAQRFAGRSRPLKSALLDQRMIAGLGNIYACEALWRARLSPRRGVGSLVKADGRPRERLDILVASVRAVIAEAIAAGGSSLRDHIRTDGTLGYFQHAFSVYGRAGAACRRPACGDTVRRIVQSGRSTFYCPSCQR